MSQFSFDFYKMVVALGDREDSDYRDTFFLFLKIHTSLIAGYCALAAYALAEQRINLLLMISLVALFAVVHGVSWRRQNTRHAEWNAHWRDIAATIERTVEFRKAVGMESVSLWSHPKVCKAATGSTPKSQGATAKSHITLIDGITCLHASAFLTSLLYVAST